MRENNHFITKVGGAKRDIVMDAGAGLLMILVIFLHAGLLKTEQFSLTHVIGFYMPWFFFKSGMFHKHDEHFSGKLLIKYLRRLGIPYITLLVVTSLFQFRQILSQESAFGVIYFIFTNEYGSLKWFLEALFISNIIFVIINKTYFQNVIITAVFFFVISDYFDRVPIELPDLFKEIPNAMFYMCMGFLLKEKQYFINKKWWTIAILTMLYLSILFLYPSKLDMRLQKVYFGCFEIAVIGNIVGIILFNNTLKAIEKWIPSVFVSIGKESFAYYVLHIPILSVLGMVYRRMGFDGIDIILPILVIGIVPIIIYIAKRIKLSYLIGVE